MDIIDPSFIEKAKENEKKRENLYMVTIQPYYEPRTQQYIHIMTMNALPSKTDPLYKIVKILPTPRMTKFIQEYQAYVYAVYDPEDTSKLINMDRVSAFFEYIFDNGYKLNRTLSNIMTSPAMRNKAIGPRKDILCFIEKRDAPIQMS